MGIKFKKPKIKIGKKLNIAKTISSNTKAFTRGAQDIYTLGNRKAVDGLTGGLLSSFEGATGGNTKDIFRTGATGAAAFFGGPAGALAVNKAFSSGGSPLQAGAAYLTTSEDNMGFLDQILDKNSAVGNLANSYLTGLANGKKKPKPLVVEAPASVAMAAPVAAGMDYKKMALIGGGILGAIMLIAVVLKRK